MEQNTYDKQTAKFIAVVCENTPPLASEMMQAWIQNPIALQRALKSALDVDLVGGEVPRAQVWKELPIGGRSTLDLLQMLDDDDFVGTGCKALLEEVHDQYEQGPAPRQKVKLVRISVKELGFIKPVTFRKILERAEELGLALCPPIVAPHLRLEYDNQPENEELYVACTPIKNSEENDKKDMFCLCYDSDRMTLDRALLDEEYLGTRSWKLKEELVFVLK